MQVKYFLEFFFQIYIWNQVLNMIRGKVNKLWSEFACLVKKNHKDKIRHINNLHERNVPKYVK